MTRRKKTDTDLPDWLRMEVPVRKMTRATSESHPLEIGWVALPAGTPGRLGITIAPGKKGPAMLSDTIHDRDLYADLTRLRDVHRADTLCDCTQLSERDFILSIPGLAEATVAHGVAYLPCPIEDVSAPRAEPDIVYAVNIVTHLAAQILEGRTVVVNCRGGCGRSGMIAACTLAALGVYPPAAMKAVRDARPGAIETREQEGFIWQAALRLLGIGWGDAKSWLASTSVT